MNNFHSSPKYISTSTSTPVCLNIKLANGISVDLTFVSELAPWIRAGNFDFRKTPLESQIETTEILYLDALNSHRGSKHLKAHLSSLYFLYQYFYADDAMYQKDSNNQLHKLWRETLIKVSPILVQLKQAA